MSRFFNARWFALSLPRSAVEYLRQVESDLSAAELAKIPNNGSAGEFLKKSTSGDYDTEWAVVDHNDDLSGLQGGTSGEYYHLSASELAGLHSRSHAVTSVDDHTAGAWKVFYSNDDGHVVELALGDAGKVLQSNGNAAPSWEAFSGSGYETVEDDGTPVTQRSTINFIGAGVSVADSGGKTVVTVSGGSGSGDVVGPASSLDSEIALFDSTTGKVLKRATTTGILMATSGVIGAATAGVDYAAAANGVTNGDSHDHNGGDGAQIAYSSLSGLPTLGTAAATDATDYAPASKGVTNGDSHDHNGGDGAQIAYSSLSGTPTIYNQTVEDEGTPVTQRGTVNFVGAGVTVTDSGGKTQVSIPGGSGEAFPVGAVFISVVSTNPSTLLGYGTWASFGAGRVLVGFDSGDSDFDAAEKTGGAKTKAISAHSGTAVADHASHTHTYTDVVNHTHAITITDPGHTHTAAVFATDANGSNFDRSAGGGAQGTATTDSSTTGITASSADPAGGVATGTTAGPSATLTHSVTQPSAHTDLNVVQPYIAVYMWKRTA